jgi:hypothetical protein
MRYDPDHTLLTIHIGYPDLISYVICDVNELIFGHDVSVEINQLLEGAGQPKGRPVRQAKACPSGLTSTIIEALTPMMAYPS